MNNSIKPGTWVVATTTEGKRYAGEFLRLQAGYAVLWLEDGNVARFDPNTLELTTPPVR